MEKRIMLLLFLFLVSCGVNTEGDATKQVEVPIDNSPEKISEEPIIEDVTDEEIGDVILPEKPPVEKPNEDEVIEKLPESMQGTAQEMQEQMSADDKKAMMEKMGGMQGMMEQMGNMPNMESMDEMMEKMQKSMQDEEGKKRIFSAMDSFVTGEQFDFANPLPKLVSHNFVDLDRIEKISKYRSGYGHDYSLGTGENCRSMKHYFWAYGGVPQAQHNPSWRTIQYYAPVSGTIKNIQYQDTIHGTKEAQFSLQSSEHSAFNFNFFHLELAEGLQEGSTVEAGQLLGNVAKEETHVEIAVTVFTTSGMTLVSFFDLLQNNVWQEYADRGLTSMSELKISKEKRDADPLKCDESTEEGRFVNSGNLQNWVTLQ